MHFQYTSYEQALFSIERKSECIASIAATVLHKTYSSLNVTEDYSQINNYLVHMMRFI